MRITLRVWRQKSRDDEGRMVTYELDDVNENMSFLEMLDVLNEKLTLQGEDPIAFDHDCREGICGACGVVINGVAHGPEVTTTCQLHMRSFKDGDVIEVEPWRAKAFPVTRTWWSTGARRPHHPGGRLYQRLIGTAPTRTPSRAQG